MSFLGEFRKLLFGVKSVSKSGAEKVVKKSKDIGEDIFDTSQDTFDVGKEKMNDIGDKIGDGIDDLNKKARDMAEDFSDSLSKNETVKKAGDFTEKVGAKVIEKSGEYGEKAGELSVKVGEKVLDMKDKLMDKAEDLGETLKEKYDETALKAEALKKEEELNGNSEFADTPLDVGGSFIEGQDDFFSRAQKYADGDYSGTKKETPVEASTIDLPKEDVEIISETEDLLISKQSDSIQAKNEDIVQKTIAGFEDLDGDGDVLVDDAILEDDDNNPKDSSDTEKPS